eukprot:CAMPEP_0180528306 /NCGR_PEP_ID=MMETSP1036_2-20121128/60716_1 /TAXON_ID=632150 /ORGANISM="Azadinium spinosum, Strain 3D9" /LENGTH=58 /DNA_ID=CAMNT_0022541833 /DNA_START=49 /DNA_END=222 /DNA_ORIENTATION=+
MTSAAQVRNAASRERRHRKSTGNCKCNILATSCCHVPRVSKTAMRKTRRAWRVNEGQL